MTTTLNLEGRDAGEAARATPGLVLVYAEPLDGVPTTIPVEDGRMIGREPPPTHVAVPHAAISRMHVRLSCGDKGCALEDLRSRNGTFVNGARVREHALRHGDLVMIGEAVFKFVADLAAYTAPALPRFAPEIVGGAQIARVLDEVRVIAQTALPVLITGETGVGKEMFARAFHEASGRPGPFVALGCATLPPDFLAPEQLATASGGTLFLDELGELALPAQAKLLRVLEASDIKVVAATHRELATEVMEGHLRADLFARISGHVLRLPPLRERIEDVPALIEHFLGAAAPRPASSFFLAACHYAWPFNIRELRNAVERASALARGHTPTAAHLPDPVRAALPSLTATPARASRDTAALPMLNELPAIPPVPDRDALLALVVEHAGNVTAIARALQRDRALILRWIKRHNISLDDYRK